MRSNGITVDYGCRRKQISFWLIISQTSNILLAMLCTLYEAVLYGGISWQVHIVYLSYIVLGAYYLAGKINYMFLIFNLSDRFEQLAKLIE